MALGIGENSAFEIRRGEFAGHKLSFTDHQRILGARKEIDQAVVTLSETFDDAALPVIEGARISLVQGSSDVADALEAQIYGLVQQDAVSMRVTLQAVAEANRAGRHSVRAATAPGIRADKEDGRFKASAAAVEEACHCCPPTTDSVLG